MWMSLALSRTAVSRATLTRLMIGLPATILSRSVVGPSSTLSRSTTSTSDSAREGRNASTLVSPAAYFLMNSRMLASSASTGRILQPESWRSRSILGSDCGSVIATVSVPWTLNIGTDSRRSASSAPTILKTAGSIRPWRSWQPGMPSVRASIWTSVALLMTPCSISISPSGRPDDCCSISAFLSCASLSSPSCTSISPMRSLGRGELWGGVGGMGLQEAPDGGVGVLEVLEVRRQVGQLEHLADGLVGAAHAQGLPAAAHLLGHLDEHFQPLAVDV